MQLIKTEAVTVKRIIAKYDDLGEFDGSTVETEEVECIVEPGGTSDMEASRPNGVTVSYTVHFPKTYEPSLRGASLLVRGEEFAVIGDPQGYTGPNTPGPYNRPVEVSRSDG